jgi:hypothetical protein
MAGISGGSVTPGVIVALGKAACELPERDTSPTSETRYLGLVVRFPNATPTRYISCETRASFA